MSGKALASVIRSNPELKILDVRGCKRACIGEYDLLVTEREGDPTTAPRPGGAGQVPLVFQELGRMKRVVEDLKVGWRFGDAAQLAIQSASLELKNFSVGIGGTITDGALEHLSGHSTSLKQLSLAFQVTDAPDAAFYFENWKIELWIAFSRTTRIINRFQFMIQDYSLRIGEPHRNRCMELIAPIRKCEWSKSSQIINCRTFFVILTFVEFH